MGTKLPCKDCSDHFKQILKELPVDDHLTTREDFMNWTIDVHNLANKNLKKPEMDHDTGLSYITKECTMLRMSEPLLAMRWTAPGSARVQKLRKTGHDFLISAG